MKNGILIRTLALVLALALPSCAALAASTAKDGEEEIDVTAYSYSIKPIYGNSPYYVYVRTDNPDPMSFRLYDPESVYYSDGQSAYFLQEDALYADVRYEDKATYRVKGGYVFMLDGSGTSDGGTLVLTQRKRVTSYYGDYNEYVDTQKKVSCQKLLDYTDGVIADFVKPGQSFFEALDAVQTGLYKYAIYPRGVADPDNPSKNTPWPLLASSPYEELSLNEHYDMMYEGYPGGMLLQKAYPYVLDSASFPGTIVAVARRLQPDCQIAIGAVHWERQITYNGETRTYGWAGRGTDDPIYTDQVDELYLFDGSSDDWAAPETATIDNCSEMLDSYNSVAAKNKTEYADQINGETFVKTITATGGTWIRVFVEGLGYKRDFAYVIPVENGRKTISNAWVDGRYIGKKEILILGAKFSDYPTAGIVVHNVQFTDDYGHVHKQDVRYDYDSATDTWVAYHYDYGFRNQQNAPASFTLTRAQVEAMKPDANSFEFPSHCLIYEGSAKPGTGRDIVTGTFRVVEGSDFCLMDWASVGEPYTLSDAFSFQGRTDDYPEGQAFKAWRIDGRLYASGETYTPTKDFEAVGIWKRMRAYMTGNCVVEAKVGKDETATGSIWCAFYDAAGMLVSAQRQQLKTGQREYQFDGASAYSDGATEARVFMVDDKLVPLGERETVELKWLPY